MTKLRSFTAGAFVAILLSVVASAQTYSRSSGVNSAGTVLSVNLLSPASAYHNWGTTVGTTGYGLRDNAGTMEFKNSGGAWTSFSTATSFWNRVGIVVEPATAGDTISTSGVLTVTGTGQSAIGAAAVAGVGLALKGTMTASGTIAIGTQVNAVLTAAANSDVLSAFNLGSAVYAKGAFTGLTAHGFRLFGSNMTASGTGTFANASVFYIGDVPIIGTNNFAIWVDSGTTRLDGDVILANSGANDVQWGRALVALGGGAAPTLGTIGGTGPATAAQNTWMRVLDSTGAAFWVPAWK